MACYVLYYYIEELFILICKACVTIASFGGGRRPGNEAMLRYLFLFFTIPQALPDEKQREMVSKELWVDANVVQYVAEQEEEMKTKMATSSKYKMYRSVVEVDRQPRSQALPPSAK